MQSTAFLIAVFEFVLLIFSLSVHECAHAWTASWFGDQTARLEGRVTLNPMYHIDPIGTLLFPALIIFGPFIGFSFFSGFLVGWAKPTPVITRNLRKIVRDDNLVTLAGPISNLLIALVAFIILAIVASVIPSGHQVVAITFLSILRPGLGDFVPHPLLLICSVAIIVNLSLLVFNLLPIPPLDGSRILRNLLPYRAVQAYDRIPLWVSYVLMIFLGGYVMSLVLSPAIGLVYFGLMRL